MKPLRWWAPVGSAAIALGAGLLPYAALNSAGKMPLWLRDHPWPMELTAALATVVAVTLAIRAFRQHRVRVVATLCALLATGATALFASVVHVGSYQLPPPPRELAVGTAAPDFTLPDQTGHPVALASLRGHPTLLVFYRGFW